MFLNGIFQLKKIAGDMNPEAFEDFEKAWKEDLGVLFDFQHKYDVLDVANAYLLYYGASNLVVDCDYDKRFGSFVWKVESRE